MTSTKHAAVIGSGPNGLAAAITLLKAGLPVTLYEESRTIGGTCRSQELIEEGSLHDLGSAVHPLAMASPFFKDLPLHQYGLQWILPSAALAHPFDDGTAVLLTPSIHETASMLEGSDGRSYKRLMGQLVEEYEKLVTEVMSFPRFKVKYPKTMMTFGLRALYPVVHLARKYFINPKARALLGGLGAHSIMNLYHPFSAAAGILLGVLAHTTNWPLPKGGAQSLANSLGEYFTRNGGTIKTSTKIDSLSQLSSWNLVFLDITPGQFLDLGESDLPPLYTRRLREYKYGPSIFKMDWILKEPIPWKARDCHLAGTVHLGGTLEEIVEGEREVFKGEHPTNPYIILVQPTLFDRRRTERDHELVWAYCHVPYRSSYNMTEIMENQIERFAPGFKESIKARSITTPLDLQRVHPNCIGGDISGGVQSIRRLLLPTISYKTPLSHVFLCSSSTPPGPGVHGMCGERAVKYALRRENLLQ